MRHAPIRLKHDVWREVSRHLEIGESVEALLAIVATTLPVRWCVVRRVLPDRSRVDTVATAGDPPALAIRGEIGPARRASLGRWLDGGHASHWSADARDPLRDSIAAVADEIVAGPLGPGGVVVFGGDGLADDVGVVQDLLEPFATALVNDQRQRELTRLREAAEADRRALLSRLDRQDVSDAIVGADGGLRAVMERVDQVARTDAPVLILGETGSGKEVVARAIHGRSHRSEAPFLRVNCGAIPADLVDSELFGHERGAFTGAIGARKGWFERADGGTLFLDEIGELPAAAQVRLLRVLQDGTFQRVGAQHTHTVDVRIVAATHRDLPALVRSGAFREDLWYRISVFPIDLPPLRRRPEDIPALVRHFAARAGTRLHGAPIVPTDADVALFLRYAWPGNVRELAAVIERAAILGDGRRLDATAALGGAPPRSPEPAPAEETDVIVAALERCRGRIEGPFGAAEALGVNPHTLRSRLRRLGIDWARFRRRGGR